MVWAARRWSDMSVAERRALKSRAASERADRAFVRRSLPDLERVTRALHEWGASPDEIADIIDAAFRGSRRTASAPVRSNRRAKVAGYVARRAVLAGAGLGLMLAASGLQSGSPAESAPISLSILNQQCLPGGGVEASLGWLGTNPSGGPQWVDIGLVNNGWLPGTFTGSSALAPGSNYLSLTGLAPGVTYQLRVTQLQANGIWDTSGTYSYTTPAYCAVVIAQPNVLTVTRTTTGPTTQTLGARTTNTTTAGAAGWSTSASTSVGKVQRGRAVGLGVTVRRTTPAAGLIDIEVHGPSGRVFQKSYDNVAIGANSFRSFATEWEVPANAPTGTYIVRIGVFTPGWDTLLYWNNNAASIIVN
jgi:hypothetical protein